MKVKRMLAALATMVLVTMGALVVTSEPALALPNCSSGRVCTYWDSNGGGSMYYYTGPYDTCLDIGYPWNDNISSAQNTISNRRVRFYSEAGCTGYTLTLNYGGTAEDHVDYMTGYPYFFNDTASSLKIIP